jgi:hypothetical protein
MERYWRVFIVLKPEYDLVTTNRYLIERPENFLHINEDLLTLNTLEVLPSSWLTLEIEKEDALKALKIVLNSLNLPKEINQIKHKF